MSTQVDFDFNYEGEPKAEHPTTCSKCGKATRVHSLETVYCPDCQQIYDYIESVNNWIVRGIK